MKQAVIFGVFALSVSAMWGASISGTVVDDTSGAPLAKADVAVFGYRPVFRTRTRTADDGTFQIGDLPAGDFSVAFGHKGFIDSGISFRIENGDPASKILPIRMVRLGAIEGQLTGLGGRSARVLALAASIPEGSQNPIWKPVVDSIIDCCDAPAASPRGTAVAGSGAFRIADLPPGVYALLVSYSDPDGRLLTGQIRYPDKNTGFALNGDGGTLRVQIPIPAGNGRNIDGKIELPDSQTWYSIALSNPDNSALAVATTVTGDKGAFAFHDVVPGIYDLLAVPGKGERGARPILPETAIYTGFARLRVDIREKDAPAVALMPQESVNTSAALEKSGPEFPPACGNANLVLTPLEDWGVNLERAVPLVNIVQEGKPLLPERVDGLAPAQYGLTSHFGDCPIAGDPIFDLSKGPGEGMDANVNRPGIVRGHAGIPTVPRDQPSPWEVLLIPEDFTEGLAVLPANWFRGPAGWYPVSSPRLSGSITEAYGASGFVVKTQFVFGAREDSLPYVRISAVAADARFEFADVPTGNYRIAARPTDPALTNPSLPGWREMQRISLSPAGIAETDVAIPNLPPR